MNGEDKVGVLGGPTDRNGLEVLDRRRCLELLGSTPVGRIVFTERALPAIRPVNFVIVDSHIVIRTSGHGALGAAADGAVVAFEADDFAGGPAGAWSVTVLGRIQEITDLDRLAEVESRLLNPWTPVMGGRYLAVSIDKISGRRIPE